MSNDDTSRRRMLAETMPRADDELVRSGRDAAATRRALVRAARRRFATDGYRATTVRQIAADAGVNVALINRYFESKEGLFEACMMRTSDELDTQSPDSHIRRRRHRAPHRPRRRRSRTATTRCSCCCCCAPPGMRTPTRIRRTNPRALHPAARRQQQAGERTTRARRRSCCAPSSRSRRCSGS